MVSNDTVDHEYDAEIENEPYHDRLGVKEGEDGDVFLLTEDDETLLSRHEALELAGMLIRNVEGGFKPGGHQNRIKIADMAIDIVACPEGPEGDRLELEKHEFIDPDLWCWYGEDTDALLEFAFGKREGFEQ